MKLLDLTLATPADNLACDEALLNWSEAGDGGEILRFWEPREHFIVVGYANQVESEVNTVACRARGVPVLRRCSGGGTVLQGPGCLNYALILNIAERPALASISSVNRFIMERNAQVLQSVLGDGLPAIAVRGHTDLALGERKFSGNSQRRLKRTLLFHGTFLLHLDLALMTELLRMPTRQPDYRHHRGHIDFLTSLNMRPTPLKNALREAWKATKELPGYPEQETCRLAAEKYSTREWNFKL